MEPRNVLLYPLRVENDQLSAADQIKSGERWWMFLLSLILRVRYLLRHLRIYSDLSHDGVRCCL